jgi:hypothetical protein
VAMEGLADASQPQRSLRQPVVLFDCIAWTKSGWSHFFLFDLECGAWPKANYLQLPIWDNVWFRPSQIEQVCISEEEEKKAGFILPNDGQTLHDKTKHNR